MKVIIAAAGTGGHINPGIAIANKIKKEQPNSKIIFIGTTRGLENDLVPRAGYELKTIEAYGLSKKVSITNMRKMIKTFQGFFQAKSIIKAFEPDIVIGTGGYICGATILSAHRQNIPTILHESNAFPGKAVKMLSNKVDKILVGFNDAKERLGNTEKVVLTGTPTKINKINFNYSEKKEKLRKMGLNNEKPVILVFGGSQGAQVINEAILGIIKNKLNDEYQIIWAAGSKQYDIIKEELEELNISINNIQGVKIFPYIYNMEEIMNLSDIVVCRSGAITITEISKLGKPAIFIPLPNVSENHQEYNAKVLENENAAKILLNKDLKEKVLNDSINDIIKDKNKLEIMGQNAQKIVIENVEEKIYNEIIKLVNKNNVSN